MRGRHGLKLVEAPSLPLDQEAMVEGLLTKDDWSKIKNQVLDYVRRAQVTDALVLAAQMRLLNQTEFDKDEELYQAFQATRDTFASVYKKLKENIGQYLLAPATMKVFIPDGYRRVMEIDEEFKNRVICHLNKVIGNLGAGNLRDFIFNYSLALEIFGDEIKNAVPIEGTQAEGLTVRELQDELNKDYPSSVFVESALKVVPSEASQLRGRDDLLKKMAEEVKAKRSRPVSFMRGLVAIRKLQPLFENE